MLPFKPIQKRFSKRSATKPSDYQANLSLLQAAMALNNKAKLQSSGQVS